MNTIELSKNDPRIAHFVRGYKGRLPVKVSAETKIHLSNYWDGGSKDDTNIVNLDTHEYMKLSDVGYVQQEQGNPYHQLMGEAELKPGLAALTRVTFMGRDRGFRLQVHPSDFQRFQ